MSILPSGFSVTLTGQDLSSRYGRKLLEDLGAPVTIIGGEQEDHPAKRWADSGLMCLTGAGNGQPQICPVPLPGCADGALDAFRALSVTDILPGVAGAQLLTERAALTEHRNQAGSSVGGHCRLLATLDGCIGLSLTRAEDWDLLPAWLVREGPQDWDSLSRLLRERATHTLVERGRVLGLAVVDARTIPHEPCAWLNATRHSMATGDPAKARAPRVLDLSSLWAGPLCSHLWQAAGAEVIKVEGTRRPDGARSGPPAFFELLNQGKDFVALELHTATGHRQLHELIQEVDIVLEGSRPRALRQMGIFAEQMIESMPHLTWVSITGYGRREPQANWIAYGDDAGVGAGLSAILREVTGEWLLCGDAIADPLTGLHAAVAGWASWRAGGGHLVELSLEQTVRHCITATAPDDGNYRARHTRWSHYLDENHLVACPPQVRGLKSIP